MCAQWLSGKCPGVAPLGARARTVSEEGRPVNAQLLFGNQDIGLVELT